MFRGHILRAVVLLQELAHGLGVAPDGVGLPLVVGPAGVRLVELGRLVVVEAGDEAGDAEGTATVGLGVPLLKGGNIPGQEVGLYLWKYLIPEVFDGWTSFTKGKRRLTLRPPRPPPRAREPRYVKLFHVMGLPASSMS